MDDAFTDERDSSRSDPLSSDEYEIEDILAHRWSGKHGCFKYFVKWKGCPPEQNWWVLETHLNKQAKDAYTEKLEGERAKKPMNKQVLLSATHNDTTHFRTNPTKDFIVPDDAIIPRAATSSSSSGANLIAHGDDNPDKPGSSRQYTAVLEHRRKSKKRHWQKKQSKEKFDGNILPRK
ncbi:hypothetical protein AAVH_06568 [Aphelenchoides avenae]|nr:hypothetical protein AAVH_06568 [Aphelenchus avenae]